MYDMPICWLIRLLSEEIRFPIVARKGHTEAPDLPPSWIYHPLFNE